MKDTEEITFEGRKYKNETSEYQYVNGYCIPPGKEVGFLPRITREDIQRANKSHREFFEDNTPWGVEADWLEDEEYEIPGMD